MKNRIYYSALFFSAERASKIGHPAPFPIELPYRLIQLYTFQDDVVLDPFVGSGTTCLAALKTKRRYIGYDNDKKYCELAEKRIFEYKQSKQTLFSQMTDVNVGVVSI